MYKTTEFKDIYNPPLSQDNLAYDFYSVLKALWR